MQSYNRAKLFKTVYLDADTSNGSIRTGVIKVDDTQLLNEFMVMDFQCMKHPKPSFVGRRDK